jgi:hypothetical protein
MRAMRKRIEWPPAALALCLACAAGARAADPLAVVPPLSVLGPFPVGCSGVAQDYRRLASGEIPGDCWEGVPRSDGAPRIVTDLLLPDGSVVPRMQRGGESPILSAGQARWPLLLVSHGLSGSPLSRGYLALVTLFASDGYVVAAPLHSDRRFADIQVDQLGDVIGAILQFDRFVAMQAVRPLGLVANLDLLLAHPHWRDLVDAERIGGFGPRPRDLSLLRHAGTRAQFALPHDRRRRVREGAGQSGLDVRGAGVCRREAAARGAPGRPHAGCPPL